MKKLYLFFIFISCISCTNYGEKGDGNGNLKHEFLTEKCESKPNYESWLFLRPENKTVCYQYFNGEKFSGTSIEYHYNGNTAFIYTYEEGEEIIEKRKTYDVNGTLIKQEEKY
jgi:hypothetical protein